MSEEVPLLSLRNVTKRYGAQTVLLVESLELRRGESILLHGRNGIGKSTLLRILGGISTIDSGDIERHELLRMSRLGFLPQAGGLYADLTVRENLRLRRRVYGLQRIPETGAWYIDELGLEKYLDRCVAELSGGFQRLAGIAATLHVSPRWLLLDEPLTGVDAEARAILKENFTRLIARLDLCVIASPGLDGELGSTRRIEFQNGGIV